MQRKIYLSPYRQKKKCFLCSNLCLIFFFFVIILFVSSSKIVSRGQKILRKKKFISPGMESKFRPFEPPPNSIVPLETKSIWFITHQQPLEHLELYRCCTYEIEFSAISQEWAIVYNEYHFSDCCIRSVNIFCRRAREHRYNWSSVRDR